MFENVIKNKALHKMILDLENFRFEDEDEALCFRHNEIFKLFRLQLGRDAKKTNKQTKTKKKTGNFNRGECFGSPLTGYGPESQCKSKILIASSAMCIIISVAMVIFSIRKFPFFYCDYDAYDLV